MGTAVEQDMIDKFQVNYQKGFSIVLAQKIMDPAFALF
jgi:hypothetical protein